MGKITDLGLAGPDDPIYSEGLRIFGKPSFPSTKTAPGSTARDPLSSAPKRSKAEGRRDNLPDAPARENFYSQEEFEEARGYWFSHVGRIRGMVDRARISQNSSDHNERTDTMAQAPQSLSSPISFTRSRTVVLLQVGPSSLFFPWSDAIVVSRTQSGVFRLCARKLTEALGARSRHRWVTLTDVKKIKSPKQFIAGVTRCADRLHVKLDWDVALAKLATLDWPFSLAVAQFISCPVPKLPPSDVLLSQPHLNRLGKVSVSIEWGYDVYELPMKTTAWIRICSGELASFTTREWYEGERFKAYWGFNADEQNSFVVNGDDCAQHFIGSIEDAWVSGPSICGIDLAQLIRQSYRTKESESVLPTASPQPRGN